MSPVGAVFVPFPPKTETTMLYPRPSPIVELVTSASWRGEVKLLLQHIIHVYEVQPFNAVMFVRMQPPSFIETGKSGRFHQALSNMGCLPPV